MNFKFTKLIPVGALLCFVLASCKKNDAVTSPSSQVSPQLMRTTNVIDLGQDEVATEAANVVGAQDADPADCKVTTYDPSYNVYPHLKTVDFGSGCTDSLGKTISGKRLITEYADWKTAPAGTRISVTTFSNYYINGLSVQGSTATYMAVAASSGTPTFRLVITKTLTDDQGNSSTFIGTIYNKQVSGYGTDTKDDDNYEMTGGSWGTEIENGVTLATWKATIDPSNPVYKSAKCSFRGKGAVKIAINTNGVIDNEYLNYGDGTCDNIATLRVNGGTPEEITLPLVFYTAHL